MENSIYQTDVGGIPPGYRKIKEATDELKFSMASDLQTGSLLRTLAASKPSGRFLELGTGTGLATSWITAALDKNSTLISIDNDALLMNVATKYINDGKIEFILGDAYEWIKNYHGSKFDFIFADAMPGKYDLFEETIDMLNHGGFYIIDDMLPQSNWPEGHDEKVKNLIDNLEKRNDLVITKLNWSTGIIIAVKK
ncbi:MAG TPA: class I SAM-dependent methyltransferase [Chitinophagaceae bacterium]|nr:class I SAM-dependent methyltransferase [Chitinophagaceae bacterium]